MKCPAASSLIVLACVSVGFSEEVVREVSWTRLKQAGPFSGGEVLPGEGPGPTEQLKIENLEKQPKTFKVLELAEPGVTARQYAVLGDVRYENADQGSYLEMWSCFADGGRYFTRTLDTSGPMMRLEGSSDWRPFSLPFFITEGSDQPGKLEVNVVLAGRGTVYLGPLRLVQYPQYPESQQSVALPGAWWDDRTAGLVGGIGGTVVGLLGGLIGTLAGFGKARRFVTALAVMVAICGVAALIAGVVAVRFGQPYAVWYPLLLGGGIDTAVFGGLLPVIRRRYAEIELRRMTAMDIGGAGRTQPKPSC